MKSTNKRSKNTPNSGVKEYTIKEKIELLEFLITKLNYTRTKAKQLLQYHLVSISGAPVTQFNLVLYPNDVVFIHKHPIRQQELLKKSKVSEDKNCSKNQKEDLNNLNDKNKVVSKRKQFSSLVQQTKIIYEDDYIIAIDKPCHLLSIPSDDEKEMTAYRIVMDYVQHKNKSNRIFVVHRIDKETSGVLIFAKDEELAHKLSLRWNDYVKERKYYAITQGTFQKKEDTITNYLKENNFNLMYVTSEHDPKGKKCITKYKVLKESNTYSLLDVSIDSGRKNQIRVTLGSLKDLLPNSKKEFINHYVIGDDKYGKVFSPINRLGLHAYKLVIYNPINKKTYSIETPIPREFNSLFKN